MKHTTFISGYEVEIENTYDCGDPVTETYVSFMNSYSASLPCLEGEGVLTHCDGNREHRVSDRVVNRIVKWAVDHGY